MMTDPIADMLTRIRNASVVRKKEVVLPFSKMKMAVANVLLKEGYLASVKEQKDAHPSILLSLKYSDGEPAIRNIKRVSKPGHRQYFKYNEIKPVLNGFGKAILSTSRGVLTDAEARATKTGGELICEVY